MALPNIYRLNRCCGCLSLQKGSIVIGTVGMLMILILICYQLVLIVVNEHCYQESALAGSSHVYNFKHQGYNRDDDHDDHDDHDDDDDSKNVRLKEFKYIERRRNGKNVFECPHWIKYNYNTARFILGMTAIMLCIYFFLIALMVHGARTARPNLMAPWLMWTLVHIVFAILTLIGIGHLPPSDVLSELFVLGLLTYFFCVVNSYYHQLRYWSSVQEFVNCTAQSRGFFDAVIINNLRETENGGAGALVVAMSRQDRNNLNSNDMFVTIPSPRKADLPPPYPGMDNPNYSPYLNYAGTGMEAANYAVPPYPGPGGDPPGYGDICGGTSDSLAVSLPPPPAYSFSNNNNNNNIAESQALSPPPPPGFAGASQDSFMRTESTSGATHSLTTTDGNTNNGSMEVSMTTDINRGNCDEAGYRGVVSDNLVSDNTVRNTPMDAFATTGIATENGKEACVVTAASGSSGKKSSMVSVKGNQDETTPRMGFENPAYDGCDPTAAAVVLPPPQQYGDSEDYVQGATAATSDTTESQTYHI